MPIFSKYLVGAMAPLVPSGYAYAGNPATSFACYHTFLGLGRNVFPCNEER